MSIDIDWPRLTTGPEGAELAASIRDFIHDRFQQVELPRFIRSVQVHSFDFGDECPTVEIKDFGDPWAEFYEDEKGSSEGDGEQELEAEVDGPGERYIVEEQPNPFKKPNRPSDASLDGTGVRPPSRHSKPSYVDTHHPAHPLSFHRDRTHPPFSGADTQPNSPQTPFLSGSNTPGIPGGTSNLSYFHLPLGGGLRSGTQTPLAAAFGPSSLDHNPRSSSPVRTHQPSHTGHWDLHSRPNIDHSALQASILRDEEARTAVAAADDDDDDDRSNDLQTTLHTTYSGNLSLSLTAEILLDYPMPSFVGIPLALKITGLSFDGVALLAYMRPRPPRQKAGGRRMRRESKDSGEDSEGDESNRGRCHFCFLDAEDARVVIGDSHGSFTGAGTGAGDGMDESVPGRPKESRGGGGGGEKGLGGLLREIRVETEIGRQENGKQVLKNVGKVEKFVLEQVRRIFEEEFVWPSFWTFLV